MLVLLLILAGLLSIIAGLCILVLQAYNISKGKIRLDPSYNGPAHVSVTLLTLIRLLLKRSVYLRKFILQYVAHLAVRVMYYVDQFSTFMYAKSRNWFVKNAVRNRGTVPHFWEHLKVYKQEMDREKDEE
jgi:hypothetical protein